MPKKCEKSVGGCIMPEKGLPWDLHREQMYTYYYTRLGQMKGVSGMPKSKVCTQLDTLKRVHFAERSS